MQHKMMACFFLWSCTLATELQHGAEKRTRAWETLLEGQTKAQSTAGMECPNGRCIDPTQPDAECYPFIVETELPVLWLLNRPANIYASKPFRV